MMLISDDYWEIRKTKNKGKGLFAKKNIAKGTVMGDYIGKVLRPEEAIVDEENIYLMYYSDRAVISPDLKKSGVHLLNHSCIPNSFLYIQEGHTLAFALREILKGEEITIPYLLSPKDKFCNPCIHLCKCGNLKCTGTMHLPKNKYDKWRQFSDSKAKQTKRKRITYGKELPILIKYPEKIDEKYIKTVNKLFA